MTNGERYAIMKLQEIAAITRYPVQGVLCEKEIIKVRIHLSEIRKYVQVNRDVLSQQVLVGTCCDFFLFHISCRESLFFENLSEGLSHFFIFASSNAN